MASNLLQQGRAAAMVGDTEEARRLLRAAAEESPTNIAIWLELIGVAESIEEKQEYVHQILALDPEHPEAMAIQARIEQKLAPEDINETDEAIVTCVCGSGLETALRCNRCEKPICPKCARTTPIGYSCPECVARVEGRFYDNVKDTYLNPYDRPQTTPIVLFVLMGINIVIYIAQSAISLTGRDWLLQYGANNGFAILENGEIWRLLTSMFLHLDAQHIAFNMFGLLIFGHEMERLYGRWRFAIIYFLSGLFGSLASFGISGYETSSAGASGAIFGILGMNIAFFWLYRQRTGEYGRQRRQMMWILVAISLALGFTILPSDNVAHMGGLFAGIVLGYALAPRYQVLKDEAADTRQIVDRGSVWHRWWVTPLATILLIVGTWGAISFWQGSGAAAATFDISQLIRPVSYDETITGDFEAYHLWRFAGTEGQAVRITVTSDFPGDVYVQVYRVEGPDGIGPLVAENWGETDVALRRVILPASGEYIIFVGGGEDEDDVIGHEYELLLEVASDGSA